MYTYYFEYTALFRAYTENASWSGALAALDMGGGAEGELNANVIGVYVKGKRGGSVVGSSPVRSRSEDPAGGVGDEVAQKLNLFYDFQTEFLCVLW